MGKRMFFQHCNIKPKHCPDGILTPHVFHAVLRGQILQLTVRRHVRLYILGTEYQCTMNIK